MCSAVGGFVPENPRTNATTMHATPATNATAATTNVGAGRRCVGGTGIMESDTSTTVAVVGVPGGLVRGNARAEGGARE